MLGCRWVTPANGPPWMKAIMDRDFVLNKWTARARWQWTRVAEPAMHMDSVRCCLSLGLETSLQNPLCRLFSLLIQLYKLPWCYAFQLHYWKLHEGACFFGRIDFWFLGPSLYHTTSPPKVSSPSLGCPKVLFWTLIESDLLCFYAFFFNWQISVQVFLTDLGLT